MERKHNTADPIAKDIEPAARQWIENEAAANVERLGVSEEDVHAAIDAARGKVRGWSPREA